MKNRISKISKKIKKLKTIDKAYLSVTTCNQIDLSISKLEIEKGNLERLLELAKNLKVVKQLPVQREKHKRIKLALKIDQHTKEIYKIYNKCYQDVLKLLGDKHLYQLDMAYDNQQVKGDIKGAINIFRRRYLNKMKEFIDTYYYEGKETNSRQQGRRGEYLNKHKDFEVLKSMTDYYSKSDNKMIKNLQDYIDEVWEEENKEEKIKQKMEAQQNNIRLAVAVVIWMSFNRGIEEDALDYDNDIYWVTQADDKVCSSSNNYGNPNAEYFCSDMGKGGPYNKDNPLKHHVLDFGSACKGGCRCYLTTVPKETIIPDIEI